MRIDCAKISAVNGTSVSRLTDITFLVSFNTLRTKDVLLEPPGPVTITVVVRRLFKLLSSPTKPANLARAVWRG